MSAPHRAWLAAGQPPHPYARTAATGPCATCAAPLDDGAVALSEIETPTMANHADLFRFGARHVCPACAWLYAVGKGRPGNYLVTGECIEYLVISLDSMVTDKRPWMVALRELVALPPETIVTGVMTTDVKPRLWPRARLATVGACGLYVHAPDYDASEWVAFDLRACLALIDVMTPALAAGFAKASLFHGLWRDHARCGRNVARATALESAIAPHRGQPHFLPALIAAGVNKGEQAR